MEQTYHQVKIETVQGDITKQDDMDAVVNAANAQLLTGGGVAGAIHRAAGSGLADECRPLAPIKPGGAVITGAHKLPNSHVIHCLGPIYGKDQPENELLASCYRKALELAEEYELSSIAYPAISTGAFGYPIEEATKVALNAIKEQIPSLHSVECIRFVLFSEQDKEVYDRLLSSGFSEES
jgi:O-acetyl-ADP-ribose deacetylase (regulator of RNase III)